AGLTTAEGFRQAATWAESPTPLLDWFWLGTDLVIPLAVLLLLAVLRERNALAGQLAAAARHGIPIGIHSGGANGVPLTPGGWHSFYIEDHHGNAIAMQTALASVVFEGVLERWPDLKIVAVEAGFGWVPSWTWRMDRQWARFRDEVPHLAHSPSTYIRRNVWFSTQPIEETPRRR
ncbi:MAG: amidohydrolase family protein, partial [Alphaproteobacteria bacterium]